MVTTETNFKKKCRKTLCRCCRKKELDPVLDLGKMPLSDGFLTKEQLAEPTKKYPLEVVRCSNCSLVQILETVPPEELFCNNYPYYSSFCDALLAHSSANAMELIKNRGLNSKSFVVELASNDGYMLKNFVAEKIPVLGIDPADGPAEAAKKIGVPTLCKFFTKSLAAKLASQGKHADVIIANNVLAHVADTNGFVEGIGTLLKDEGVAVVEVPYVRDMIEGCEFDTIYHEHLCYYSVKSLIYLFGRHNLFINDIKKLPIHGGSLRLYISKRENIKESVGRFLKREDALGIDRPQYYKTFEIRVRKIRAQMKRLLGVLKGSGRHIAAYGAAAKGTIMLNYINADTNIIDFVVDRNIHKQGKYMPGINIPIYAPDRLMKEKPDYVLILPWNFKEEILNQQAPYRQTGGKFIIPIPFLLRL